LLKVKVEGEKLILIEYRVELTPHEEDIIENYYKIDESTNALINYAKFLQDIEVFTKPVKAANFFLTSFATRSWKRPH